MKFKNANNKQIYFIHAPRTAGTYVEAHLCAKYRVKNRWPTANLNNLFGLHKLGENHYITLQHLTLNEMIKFNFIDAEDNKYIFTVVRNPYDRIASIHKLLYPKDSDRYITFDDFLSKLRISP